MRDAEFEQRLLRVARGLEKADLVLKGGNVFNSFTGEWETADVAVCGSVIAGIGSYKGAEEYNMAGKYLTPGFLDAHMHIESTMLAPRELARLLLLNGVTGIFADPHEIANVLGTEALPAFLPTRTKLPTCLARRVCSGCLRKRKICRLMCSLCCLRAYRHRVWKQAAQCWKQMLCSRF